MKSADEIKKGLECCAAHDCNGCGYNCGASTCIDSLLKDISSLIQQLQAENAEKAERIKQLEAELGAAVSVVRCKGCVNRGTSYNCPMRKLVMPVEGPGSYEDCTEDMGFCHMGKRREAAQ